MKKIFTFGLLIVFSISILLLVACDLKNDIEMPSIWNNESAYAYAAELGYGGTLEEFIALISGIDGVGIASISTNEDGELVIILTDDTERNLGRIRGNDGISPHIGANGNWYIGDVDTGIKATGDNGAQGIAPHIGANGNWYVGDTDTGIKAAGTNGLSVTVISVLKTNSVGSVDTYTITFSDGTESTFNVTNGTEGTSVNITSVEKTLTAGNIDTYTISFSNGSSNTFNIVNGLDGENGQSITISSIGKTGSLGRVDTYTITFSDGTSTAFTVTNGNDGLTPYIGANGNWWIGNTDTGVLADYSQENRQISDGLSFVARTVGGKAGMVVSFYNGNDTDVVIPNYVGSVPVIGVEDNVFKNNNYIASVSLSKNTVYMGSYANSENLKTIDFNGCKFTEIPANTFSNTGLTHIELPETVTKIGDNAFYNCTFNYIELPQTITYVGNNAFYNCPLRNIDISNITYFGANSFNMLFNDYIYLTDDVEYVGSNAFTAHYVFIQHQTLPATWGNFISGNYDFSKIVTTNCSINENYIYVNKGTSITVHAYIGNEKKITIPSLIDNLPVTTIGYGFNSMNAIMINFLMSKGEKPALQLLEEVKIPNTVTKIDSFSFLCYGTMIYIPSSVTEMWAFCGYGFNYNNTSFLAFESNSYPTFSDGNGGVVAPQEWLNYNIRNSLEINPSKVEYDEEKKTYYYNETTSYLLLAVMDLTSELLYISGTYNNLPVKTIKTSAVANLPVKYIEIGSGVEKIEGRAFHQLSLGLVKIPLSVTTINAYGFNGVCNLFYVEAASKPNEWDSFWAGSNTSNYSINYSSSISNLGVYDNIIYGVNADNIVSLFKYIISVEDYTSIIIPRTINGKAVTTIKANFISVSSAKTGISVYIPNTVTTIEAYAFYYYYSSSSTWYYPKYYCEATVQPSGWNTNWHYNGYYGNNTYKYVYWSTVIYDNIMYNVNADNTVSLVKYLGSVEDNTIIIIPRTINGKAVTTIKTNFISVSSAKTDINVYIPNTVTTIEANAFYYYYSSTSTWYYPKYYCEATVQPSGWHTNWHYNGYYGYSTYKYVYWSQIFAY